MGRMQCSTRSGTVDISWSSGGSCVERVDTLLLRAWPMLVRSLVYSIVFGERTIAC